MTIKYLDSKRFSGISTGVVSGFALSSASYDSKSFSVGSQEAYPTGLHFKSDGTKMYVTGYQNNKVHQYSLSTAWDVSTASSDSISVTISGQGASQAVTLSTDGTKMYTAGYNPNRIYEYTLSSAWNISSASYEQYFSPSAQESMPTGVTFKSDGTEMYVIGMGNSRISQWSLSTAWDISTASHDSNLSVYSIDTAPHSCEFKSDGTKMWFLGDQNNKIYQYSLSTAWDLSTASSDSISFDVSSQAGTPNGFAIDSINGMKIYVMQRGSTIYQYSTTSSSSDKTDLTDVQDNSIYIETDTDKRYWFETATAPTYETDFTTNTGWTATGTDVAVDSTTNDRLDFNIPNTTNQTDAITYDLTSVSDSAWVLRFKIVMDNFSVNTTGHAKKLLIGLSSTSHSTAVESAQDAIGILFGSWSSGTKIRTRDSNGATWMDGSGTDFSETFVDNETYYVEIKRTLTTVYTVSLYSDSSYSTLIEAESETMGATDTTGLRYLKVGIDTTGSTPSGTFTGYIDDVEFYNGVTSA